MFRQESCAIAKMTARCTNKLNKYPHLHLTSGNCQLTQFNQTLWK